MNNTEWQYLEKKHSENNEILKNHPLILHVPYMPDESLNSWLLRIATKNKTSVKLFTRIFENSKRPSDFDFNLPNSDWNNIKKFIIKYKYAENPKNLETVFRHPYTSLANTIIHYKKNKIFRFCPACLSNGTPYYRAKWRFSFTVLCKKHNCWLNSQCPNCRKEQEIHKLTKSKITEDNHPLFSHCIFCGYDFKKILPTLIPSNIAVNKLHIRQKLFWRMFHNGHMTFLVRRQYFSEIHMKNLTYKFKNDDIFYSSPDNTKILSYKKMFGDSAAKSISEHFDQK